MENYKVIGTHEDTILNVECELLSFDSARDLSNILKTVLDNRDIDFAKYNGYVEGYNNKDLSIETPPHDIYEYQNFFVMEDDNGELLLLDGFRRLLWYNTPDAPIMVRKYKKSELTNKQVLSLLVSLNHFKFHGGGTYHERGFSLLMKTVFDLDIMSIKAPLDYYLSSDAVKHSYWSDNKKGQEKVDIVSNRITTDYFVDDVKFLSKLNDSKYMCNKYTGALLYKFRVDGKSNLDIDEFITKCDEHKVLQDLIVKYDKEGTTKSAKSQEIVNKILEIYTNFVEVMNGGEVVKSFAELQQDCKDLAMKYRKDKNYTKLTGTKNRHNIDAEILKRIENGEEVKLVCVLYPLQRDEYNTVSDEDFNKIPMGLREDFKLIGMRKPLRYGHSSLPKFGFDNMWVTDNYGGYMTSGTAYTKLQTNISGIADPKVELFVEIPKKFFK